MLTKKIPILIAAFVLTFTLRATAQQSLGDPVFTENFGHGTNLKPIGPALGETQSELNFTPNKCPNVDGFGRGQYCIAFGTSNCFEGTWHDINSNHTPNDPFGYMMIVNASANPAVIYTNHVNGGLMCAGAKYQFQVWVFNVLDAQPGVTDYQQPDLEFIITKTDGTPVPAIGASNTGPITSHGEWRAYSVDFLAPQDGSNLTITLKDKTIGSDNGNDFVIDDITVKPYGPVINAGITTTSGDVTTTQCLNDGPATYLLRSLAHDYLNPQYQWQSSVNNGAWVNIPGKTQRDLALNTEFQSPQTGKYRYRVGVLSAPGVSVNCQTFSEPITIDVVRNPVFALDAITPVCEGNALRLTAEGGSDYVWTLPDGTERITHYLDVSTSADASVQGIYKVRITENQCTTETQTQVVLYPALHPSVDNDNPTICEGSATQLQANGGIHYKWTPAEGLDHDDIANPMANPVKTTEYQVNISNDGCAENRTVTVNVLALPKADAGPDLTMQEGQPVKLQGSVAGGGVNHYWTPTDHMDDPTSLTPTVSALENTVYTLHVESPDNCGIASDDVNVRVLKTVTIPTTFTPNNDGANDTWHLDKLNTYPESVLTIYTRDGQQVFRTVGDAAQWNGIYYSKSLPSGVYYYVLDLKNNLPLRSGWVMLVR